MPKFSRKSLHDVWARGALLALLSTTFFVYYDMLKAPPIYWDDEPNIFKNPYYQFGLWWGVWKEPYFGLYVPVTNTVWAFLYWLGGGAAAPFRWLNISLHVANICLVYMLLGLLARRLSLSSTWWRWTATAVFALHPLQVQAVAWISGGRDLLAAFFAFACTWVYMRSSSKSAYGLATVLFACALLSKPITVVLPAAVWVLDVVYRDCTKRESGWRMLPWFMLSGAAVYLTQLGQGPHFQNLVEWWKRPLLMFKAYEFYILKTIWPRELAANYARGPTVVMAEAHWWLLPLAIGVVMGVLSFRIWRRSRQWSVVAWWFLFLLPVSGIVPFAYENIGGVADHYSYIPLAGVSALVMIGLHVLTREAGFVRVFLPVPIALILGFWSYWSWERLEVWQGNTPFFFDMARAAPNSFSAAIGMSVVMCQDVRDYRAGIEWTDKALALHPGDILALANKSMCLNQAGRWKESLALASILETLDRPGLLAKSPTSYSNFLSNVGWAALQTFEWERGFGFFCEAYQTLPSNQDHLQNLKAAKGMLQARGLKTDCVEGKLAH